MLGTQVQQKNFIEFPIDFSPPIRVLGCQITGPYWQEFFGNLASILSEVPCDWEVISLKSRCPYGRCVSKHLSKVMVDGNGGNGAACSGVNFGFFAMLYKVVNIGEIGEWWNGEELWWFRAMQCVYDWYIEYYKTL